MMAGQGYHRQPTSGRPIAPSVLADILLDDLGPRKPGDRVSCYRKRRGDYVVVGRSPAECEFLTRKFYPVTASLFRHEHWYGDLWGGRWVESK